MESERVYDTMTDWFIEAELYEDEERAERFNSVITRGIHSEEDIDDFLENLEDELREKILDE